jgi:hypothetical protein
MIAGTLSPNLSFLQNFLFACSKLETQAKERKEPQLKVPSLALLKGAKALGTCPLLRTARSGFAL